MRRGSPDGDIVGNAFHEPVRPARGGSSAQGRYALPPLDLALVRDIWREDEEPVAFCDVVDDAHGGGNRSLGGFYLHEVRTLHEVT